MERLQSILFGHEFAQSLIGVPPSSLQFHLRPFLPAFPLELVQHILYLTALHSQHSHGSSHFALLEISKSTRRHLFPLFFETLEIVGMERMISFAQVFAPKAVSHHIGSITRSPHLISSTVKRLALIDKSPGDIQSSGLIVPPDLLCTILSLCSSVQALFLNYIRPIPEVNSFRPTELTVRRGLRYIDLHRRPFKHVKRLHCRYEQLIPSLIFSIDDGTLRTPLLTHLCFTHHLDFSDSICVDIVKGCLGSLQLPREIYEDEVEDLTDTHASTLRCFPNLSVLIVEVAFQKWDVRTDPPLRSALATISDPRNRLFVRVSPYNTALPVDGMIGPGGLVTNGTPGDGGSFERDVWVVTDCSDWRTRVWTEEYIAERIAPW